MTQFLAQLARIRPIWFLVLLSSITSLIFYLFSGLDIAISYMFYAPDKGFYTSSIKAFGDWRLIGLIVPKLIIAWFICWIILRLIKGVPDSPIFETGKVMYVFLSGFMGTWVLVNLIFKEYWGRPRPVHVDVFGGEHPFVPVWQISDYCAHNCSFVSGEASSAIWSLSMLVFLPKRISKVLIWPLGFIALLLGINRIMFGGHFTSDVVLSILITLILMRFFWLFVHSTPGQATARGIDKMFNASSNWIGRQLNKPTLSE